MISLLLAAAAREMKVENRVDRRKRNGVSMIGRGLTPQNLVNQNAQKQLKYDELNNGGTKYV